MSVHPLVTEVTSAYLAAVDAAAPGVVEGLYLTGSVALGDFRPTASDIDFVAVTGRPLGPDEIDRLGRAHARLRDRHRKPLSEGIYVTWADLAAKPAGTPTGAHFHGGRLDTASRGGRHPVTWHELAGHGVRLRGPERGDLTVWTDVAALRAFSRDNLDRYWHSWHRRSSKPLSRSGLSCLTSWGPSWGVLGVARLHYTITTGKLTSKRGAGEYALDRFDDRWRRVVAEALRIRTATDGRSLYRNPFERRRESLDFMAMVLADAGHPASSRSGVHGRGRGHQAGTDRR